MDLAAFKDFGIVGGTLICFLLATWKFANKIYDQMVADKKEAILEQKTIYDNILEESYKREDRLMVHMEKQGDTMTDIANTLKRIDGEICLLKESHYAKDRVV